MRRWSLNLFRVRGIQLSVHASFFVLLAYAAWLGAHPESPEEGGGGLPGMAWNVAVLLAFFSCVVLHELGHSLTAMRFGVGVRRILLMPIGGMAEFDSIPRDPRREFLITAAGPLVNFIIAGVLWALVRGSSWEGPYYSVDSFLQQLLIANLVMGTFNLLPAFPMDGGRLVRAMLASRRPYLQATRWAANLGKVICVLGFVTAFALSYLNIAALWLLAALFAFIFAAGEMEYRAVLRREREEAHWREVLARWYATPASEEPPPLSS